MKKIKASAGLAKTEIKEQRLVDELARIAGSLTKSLAQIRHTLISGDGWSAARTALCNVSTVLRSFSSFEAAVGALDHYLS